MFQHETTKKLYAIDLSLAADKSGLWHMSGLGGAGHHILFWCCYTAHRSDCKFKNSDYLCFGCLKKDENGVLIRSCKHASEILSSSLQKLYTSLYNTDSFYKNLVIIFPPSNALEQDLRFFLFQTLQVDEQELKDLLDIKGKKKLLVKHLKDAIDSWYLNFFILGHQIPTASMGQVDMMLKIMKIEYSDGSYDKALQIAKDSPEWKRRLVRIDHEHYSDPEKRDLLTYVSYIGNRIQYSLEGNKTDMRTITKNEISDPCTLHAILRIVLYLFNILVKESGVDAISNFESKINEIFAGAFLITDDYDDDSDENNVEKKTTTAYSFIIKEDKDIKMSYTRAIKLFDRYEEIVNLARDSLGWNQEDEVYIKWLNIFYLLHKIYDWLDLRTWFSDDDIEDFQNDTDDFVYAYVDKFGELRITNYINDLATGIFKLFLQKRRNLYILNQCGVEAKIGSNQIFIKRRTQNNGFNKNNDSNNKIFSLADAMECKGLRDMIRTFDTLRGSLDLEDQLVGISRSEFNLKIKEEKRRQRTSIEQDEDHDEADNLQLNEEEIEFYSDDSTVHIPRVSEYLSTTTISSSSSSSSSSY